MSYPKVAVVILNWNGKSWLEQFLPSLITHTQNPTVEIWVADNASTDNSVAFLKDYCPNVLIHINKENYGYAGGYNMALKAIEADYYVLLNSDVEVTPNWVMPVIDFMESDHLIAACQPKLLSYKEKDAFEYAGAAGGMIDALGYPFCRGRIFEVFEKDNGQYNQECEIFWASGACMFVKANIFHQSGGLDEDFFAHMEEIDLCWRLKNMGYKIMYFPNSTVYHVGGGTLQSGSPRKTYLNFLNNRVMLIKNLPLLKSIWVFIIRDILDVIAIFKGLITDSFENSKAIIKAMWHLHLRIFKYFKKKKQVDIIVKTHKVGNPRLIGMFGFSLVFRYFILKQRNYSELVKTKEIEK